MFNYQITKYNPIYRDAQRRYLKDEWISYYDVGKKYDNEIFTYDQYIKVEDNYIEAIFQFMKCNKITSLRVTKLEKSYDNQTYDAHCSEDMKNIHKNIKNRMVFSGENLKNLCKLVLREYLWCRLKNNKNMEVDFAYDYYMDIMSKSTCKKTIENIEKSGLFVEDFESPYK